MAKTFGEKIKEYLHEHKIKQFTLAKETNISQSNISKWCADMGSPSSAAVLQLAKYMNVSVEYLLDDEIDDSFTTDFLGFEKRAENRETLLRIPFLTQEALQATVFSRGPINLEKVTEKFIIDKNFAKHLIGNVDEQKDVFMAIAKGDSMSPIINSGDFVFIERMTVDNLSDGEICFVRTDNTYTIRRIQKNPSIVFMADNLKYQPFALDDTIFVCGRIIGSIPKFASKDFS